MSSTRLRPALTGWTRDPAYRFAVPVIAAGVAVLAWMGARGDFAGLARPDLVLAVLAALTVAGEAVHLRVPRQHDDSQLSASTLFAFAILLAYGPGQAVAVFAGAVLIVDGLQRRPPIKVAFNTAQYALAMAAGGAVLTALSDLPAAGDPHFALADAPGIAAAALSVFIINHLLASTVTALAMGCSVRATLLREGEGLLATDALQILFAPVVVVVAHHGVVLLAMLGVPIAALFLSAREADRRKHATLHDALTGLPNRIAFAEQASRAIARASAASGRVAVLLLDLDRFKEINDALGHGHGDAVLKVVAERLGTLVRPGDVVTRLGGDEFAVLVPDAGPDEELTALAARVCAGLRAPTTISDLRVATGASVGVAVSAGPCDDAEALLRRADVAMYTAKEERRGVAWYDRERDPHDPARLRLAADLRDGIPRGELAVHYQPKLSLSTGRVAGVEALVRWEHPRHGLLMPGDFIELAESTDLIRPLTLAVLETAARDAAGWLRRGFDLSVAVNLAAPTLLDEDFPGTVAGLLRRHGLEGRHLILEITERTLMRDPARSAQVLTALGEHGIKVSVDDFGTGYSSLALLQRLPVAEIKVDRSFVRDLAAKPSDAAIVRSTTGLGHTLGLRVVAEGVEDGATLQALSAWGCDQAQGFLISRPVPAERLLAWLEALRAMPPVSDRTRPAPWIATPMPPSSPAPGLVPSAV